MKAKPEAEMTIADAVAQTRQFAKFLKGMDRLREAADVLENSEAVIADNAKANKALMDERERLEKDFNDSKAELADLQRDINAANEAALKIVADAKAKAKKVIDEAAQRAKDLGAEAERAVEVAKEARAARDAAVAEEAHTQERIAAAKAEARARLS